jgi:recombination protein RecA
MLKQKSKTEEEDQVTTTKDKKKESKDLTKEEQVAILVKTINKALGVEGKVYLGNDHTEFKRIPTGVLALDIVLGGGLPCAQLVELFGPESSSKSLLAMLSIAEVQRRGDLAVLVKGEGFDAVWAEKLGVDVSKLFLVEAATGDTMLETALTMLESGLVGIMVIDSFQSLGTTREMDTGVESESYGGAGAPQMWGRIMRRAYRAANSGKMDNTVLIGISQVRSKIGGFNKGIAAEDGVPTQIRAILHWKGVSIRCRRGEKFFTKPEGKGSVYAREFKLRCEKNKTAGTEGYSSSYKFMFRNWKGVPFGVDNAGCLFDQGRELGLIEASGSWYEAYGIKAQGGDNFIAELRKNESARLDLYKDITSEIVGTEAS